MLEDHIPPKNILRQILKGSLHIANQSLSGLRDQTCDIMTRYMPAYKMQFYSVLSQLYSYKIILTKLTQACCSLFQLSWIQQVLSNPDVFCFADYPCHPVVIDLLKTAPEDDNREIATW